MIEIQKFLQPTILAICLCTGYCLKHIQKLDKINDYIPLIMMIMGIVLACLISGPGIESVAIGAVTGVASSGFHQLFVRTIDGLSKNE